MSPPRQFPQRRFARPRGSTELLLVRHGQSAPMIEGEPFPMTDGQGDPPLSSLGREQAERLAERLAGEPITAIYVSSMVRTHQTAAPLAAKLGLVPVEDADLREVHLGEWEAGVLRRKAAEQDPVYVRMLAEERWDIVPGAEPMDRFQGRVVAALERIAVAHPDQQVAVFAHGGVIGTALVHAARARSFAFGGADNGSVSQLVITADRWMVRRFNDSSHLWSSLSTSIDAMT
jgi:2,3-bisphosphoglycerate-dependent phosphoglycerate mutase